MTALHRVKAYFGMVPADELDAYDEYESYEGERRGRYDHDRLDGGRFESDRYDRDRRERYAGSYGTGYGRERWSERDAEARREPEPELRSRTPHPRDPDSSPAAPVSAVAMDEPGARSLGRGAGGTAAPRSTGSSSRPATTASAGAGSSAGGSTTTRGALAVAERPAEVPEEEPVDSVRHVAPAEITTLHPKSYNEARIIGERYRDGIPVIMNLTDLDDVAAKRLVDFAAGLAFALRGSIEKVTNRVFLLSPPNVEVSADDRRKLAEIGSTGTS